MRQPSDKGMEQTNGALAGMEAPLAAERPCLACQASRIFTRTEVQNAGFH